MHTLVNDISKCMDLMISSETAEKHTSLFDEYVAGAFWPVRFRDLKRMYISLADPDALALVPDLESLFEEKTAYVKSNQFFKPEHVEKLTIMLSQCRKELGFDDRMKRNARRNSGKPLDRAR